MQRQTRKAGKEAEDYAAKFLSSKGYKVIEKNFRSKFGEIDIIALKGDTLVFVEVKARWGPRFGKPEEAVTPGKIWRISRTGEYYSLLHPELPKSMRIEVLALEIGLGTIREARVIQVD
jgi:putative endonuclease